MNPDRMIDMALATGEVLEAYSIVISPQAMVELTVELEQTVSHYDPAEVVSRLSPEEISTAAMSFDDYDANDELADATTESYEAGWELGFETSQKSPLEIYDHAICQAHALNSYCSVVDRSFEAGFRDGMKTGNVRKSDG